MENGQEIDLKAVYDAALVALTAAEEAEASAQQEKDRLFAEHGAALAEKATREATFNQKKGTNEEGAAKRALDDQNAVVDAALRKLDFAEAGLQQARSAVDKTTKEKEQVHAAWANSASKVTATSLPLGTVGEIPEAILASSPQTSGEEMSKLQRAGVDLAHVVLAIISGVLLLFFVAVCISEWTNPPLLDQAYKGLVEPLAKAAASADANSDNARAELKELLQKIIDAKQAGRAFWMQFGQMLLLNLLLPVLTAILGYVFGAGGTGSKPK